MPPSPPSRFALNPPREFGYKDWVINLPVPQFLHHDQNDHARVQVLIHSIETRFGKDRCFYSFMPHQSKSRPDKIEVTQLYAFHEVKHWPGSLQQLEWTSFVMANIEYDDMIKAYGPSASLTVPVLPATALEIYSKMEFHEGAGLARICHKTGKTIGQVIEGNIKLYAQNNGSQEINLNFDLLEHDTTLAMVSSPEHSDTQIPLTSSPVRKDAPAISTNDTSITDPRLLAHDSAVSTAGNETAEGANVPHHTETIRTMRSIPGWQIRQVAKNPKLFAQVQKNHQAWLDRSFKRIHILCVRLVCRRPGMEKVPWSQCGRIANDYIRQLFDHVLGIGMRKSKVKFDLTRARPGPIDRQLDFLCFCYSLEDPLPPQGPARSIKARTHAIRALNRQREIIEQWKVELKSRAEKEDGERYRKENGMLIDLWRGTTETFVEYEERMRNTLKA